jgi:RHS repeat-associated protein
LRDSHIFNRRFFYQVNDFDPLLRETQATVGGLSRTSVYDRANLALKTIQTGPGAAVQNLAYDWYPSGNLKQRIDYFSGRTEDFSYDALNRLDTQSLNGAQVLNVDYSSGGDGNIGFKTGVGNYAYGGTSGGPHAVSSITGLQNNTYLYDANGNMTNRDGDVITWYSHNLPKRINYGPDSTEFWYATDRSRYKQVAVEAGLTTTTRYVGDHFNIESRSTGLTIYRHFIRAGDRVIGQFERRSDGSSRFRYLHRDHLGSVVATTDAAGVVKHRFEFEPFGTRWRTVGTGIDDTERGFTGHEHLDSVDLVHMNGRVQDPLLGRFISADPIVQAPYNGQSLNRYSYVWNNPLTFADPTGFCTNDEDPVCIQMRMVLTDSLAAAGVGADSNLTLVATPQGPGPDAVDTQPPFGGAKYWSEVGREVVRQFPSTTIGGAVDQFTRQFPDAFRDATGWSDVVAAKEAWDNRDIRAGAEMVIWAGVGRIPGAKALKRFRVGPKTPLPSFKDSPFGPKIQDEIPDGVPSNWSREQVQDAIIDYRTSIVSRRAELAAFDASGKGTDLGRMSHVERIADEEGFVRSMEKALEDLGP